MMLRALAVLLLLLFCSLITAKVADYREMGASHSTEAGPPPGYDENNENEMQPGEEGERDEGIYSDMMNTDREVTPELICQSCRAVIKEMTKKIAHLSKWGETDILEALEGICEQDDLWRSYEEIPPAMMSGCSKVMEEVDDMETQVWKAGKRDDLPEYMCTDKLGMCKDFPLKVKKERPAPDNVPLVDPEVAKNVKPMDDSEEVLGDSMGEEGHGDRSIEDVPGVDKDEESPQPIGGATPAESDELFKEEL